MALRFRGQTAFGSRLIPQMQQTAGGLYTVRGYPESLVAGDTVYIGSLEYRFHLPKVLGVEPQPREVMGGPFRFAPQFPYGSADWDLVPRVFVDAAHVSSNSGGGFSAEAHENLLSTGVGLDLSIKRNLQFSVDWGWALQEARSYDRGEERVHFNFVVLY
jgi:hemolysin activation/secretion protein